MRTARWAPLAVLAGGLASGAYLALNDPADPSTVMPACPFHAVTGLWCPGCGGLRMVHATLNGRWDDAVNDNALLLLASPFLLAVLGIWGYRTLRGERFTLHMTPVRAVAVLAVVVTWWVTRNLPGFPLQPT